MVDAHCGDAAGQARSKRESVAVLFADGPTFVTLVETSDLEAEMSAAIVEAAQTAMSQPGTPVCCMRIDLSEEQLVHLNLEPLKALYE